MKNRQKRQPNPVTAPITPKTLGREMGAATRLEYRPLTRQLTSEARGSRQRSRQITKLYKGLTAQSNALAGQTAGDYQTADDRYKSYLAATGAQDAATVAHLDAQDAALGHITGANGSTDAAQREAASAAIRGINAANIGGTIQAQGANQQSYLRGVGRVAKHEGIGQRIAENTNLRKIQDDQRTLAKDKGDFRTKYVADQRAAERDYQIQLKAFSTPSQYDQTVRGQTAANLAAAKINAGSNIKVAQLGLKGDTVKANSYGNLPGGKNSGGSKGGDDKKSRQYASSLLVTEMTKTKNPVAWLTQHRGAVVAELTRSGGVSHATANQIINRYLNSRKKGGGGTDLNPFGPG